MLKKRIINILLCLLIIMQMPAAVLAQSNLILNGELENTDISPWEGEFKILSDGAVDGVFSAYLENDGELGQSVFLEPNSKYYFKARVKSKEAGNSFSVTTDNSCVTVEGGSFTASDTACHSFGAVLNTEGLPSGTAVKLSVMGTGAYAIDSLSLTEYGENTEKVNTQFVFKKSDTATEHLTEGALSTSVKIINGAVPKTLRIMSALFEGEDMKAVLSSDELSLGMGEERDVPLGNISVTDSDNQIVKNYVWDKNLKPQDNVIPFDKKEMAEFHVKVTGNDITNSGTIDSPFYTLKRAGNAVSDLKSKGKLPRDGAIVWIHGGRYEYDETMAFFSQHSGTESVPITFKAFGDGEVVFSGSKKLPSSGFKKVTDDEILLRIVDEEAREKLVQLDLKAAGISDLGTIDAVQASCYGTYKPSWVNAANYSLPEIFSDGEPLTLARYPNNGYMSVGEIKVQGSHSSDWADGASEEEKNNNFVISPNDERYLKWKSAPDALLYGKLKWLWADQTVPLGKIDTENKTLTSALPSHYDITSDGMFYAFNLLEEIDEAGEYYIDRESGTLYLYPPAKGLEKITISTMTNPVIKTNQASNIVFDGITISETRGKGVEMWDGSGIVFKNCTIKNTGNIAGYVDKSVSESGFDSCVIQNTNGGITLWGGNTETLTNGENFVKNCYIEEFSRLKKTYNPGVLLYGVGQHVTGNTICNAPHNAIQLSGNNHLIEYNDIYNVLTEADDMSAIYMGSSWLARGNVIRYNYIHDINPQIAGTVGARAVYLDNCFSSADIIGNIFANLPKGHAIVINGGCDNHVERNIFVDTYGSLWMTRIGQSQDMSGFIAQYNNKPTSDVWKTSYPELYNEARTVEDFKNAVGNTFTDNLLVNSGVLYLNQTSEAVLNGGNIPGADISQKVTHIEEVQNIKLDAENAGFTNASGDDFTLTSASVVFDRVNGFYQLPQNKTGSTLIIE